MKYFPASRGFTLIELMVTIAIVAILAMLAIPSYRDMVMKNRVSAASSELLTAINFARSEAVTRGANVALDMSSAGVAAAGVAAGGWVIKDSAAATIYEHAPLQGVEHSGSGANTMLTFDRLGGVSAVAGTVFPVTIVLKAENCPTGLEGGQRKIEISRTGRVNNTRETCL